MGARNLKKTRKAKIPPLISVVLRVSFLMSISAALKVSFQMEIVALQRNHKMLLTSNLDQKLPLQSLFLEILLEIHPSNLLRLLESSIKIFSSKITKIISILTCKSDKCPCKSKKIRRCNQTPLKFLRNLKIPDWAANQTTKVWLATSSKAYSFQV